ncbi:MAG: energy-coupling factor transporter ATPase [Anaerovoracaceae bacterium]|jgi:energy-coupling factor transport system ATP-binding protein|nr:energy-coupling factor transporter ATPase [Anaerovoracaceae bacterium]
MSIELKGVTYIFSEGLPHEQVAVKDVSFFIEDNTFVGIIGHTGSGKSTLVQHLNGLLKPNSGTILIDGKDITQKGVSMKEIRRNIGLVFQYPEYQLFEETVWKDVAFGPRNLDLEEEEVALRVSEALSFVGLDEEEVGQVSPFELSGGQKRRAAIAGVLAMRPKVLILDEPTAGLDPKGHKDILEMICKIHTNTQGIIILVSHNMEDIVVHSDKVLVMEEGRLVMEGTPSEVFSQEEALYSMGLDLPPAAQLIRKMKDKGIKIQGSPLTKEEVTDLIYGVLKQ